MLPIVVYEDSGFINMLPLVYTRGVFQLICGRCDLLARVRELLPPGERPSLSVRPWLRELMAEQTELVANGPVDGPALFLNGRAVWLNLPERSAEEGPWVGLAGANNEVACIAADARTAAMLAPEIMLDEDLLAAVLSDLPRRRVDAHCNMLRYPWNVVHQHHALLAEDLDALPGMGQQHGAVHTGSHLLNPSRIHIGEGTVVKPCVVIDAEEGPVYIGKNVKIMPHSVISGPAYIGDGTLLQSGAVVRDGSYIGPVCKVGGEIDASIIQGYSNKQHDGFLGHAYVGSWVNIAADCINSDLKNTYGTVRVPINGVDVESGEMFVGVIIGDHTKVGINVSIPTGAVIGFSSSLAASFSAKFVPSFMWINGEQADAYEPRRALEVAKRVMARRKKVPSAAEERAMLEAQQFAALIEAHPVLALSGRS